MKTVHADGYDAVPRATIVIATADRASLVYDCVCSFADQVPPDVEVCVVDAGETPVDEARLREAWQNSRLLRSAVRNAGTQRNAGVVAARSDTVIFLDDDTYVQPNWWPGIVEPLRDEGVGAVAGGVWCNPHPKLTDARGGYINAFGGAIQVTHRGPGAPREVDWPMTTNMAVRRDVLLAVGGVASVYGVYDEDIDLGLKIRKAGWRIVFQPDSAVYHYFARMQRPAPTRRTAFRLGRNRSILLVRAYGLSLRLMCFLVSAPLVQLGRATVSAARGALRAYGHAVSYCIGMIAGLSVGASHPMTDDVRQFAEPHDVSDREGGS